MGDGRLTLPLRVPPVLQQVETGSVVSIVHNGSPQEPQSHNRSTPLRTGEVVLDSE